MNVLQECVNPALAYATNYIPKKHKQKNKRKEKDLLD